MSLHGRQVIKTDQTEVTRENVVQILTNALYTHWQNQADINYLWDYYRGIQPILQRVKPVRPEINNKIVENRAFEIVSFKTGFLLYNPIIYVGENVEAVNRLNAYMKAEEKACKDKEIVDWFHIAGTAYRMVLPDTDPMAYGQEDAPFEVYTLDPRSTFVVYHNGLGNYPVMGVTCVTDQEGFHHYYCYSRTMFYEILGNDIVDERPHILRDVPIVEYPLNEARLGAFELVLPLLDAINLTDSNRMDGLEQFIQSLLLLHNVDMSEDDFSNLVQLGGLKFTDQDPQLKGEVRYLTNVLNQGEIETMVDHQYDVVLTICGMPNRNGGTSTSDTGIAVQYRDGWTAAETRAQDTEQIFKRSEKRFLRLVLNICKTFGLDLNVSDLDIRFTRRNYENILEKAQVLTMMLDNPKIHPQLAFEHSGMFIDPDLAYTMSEEYYESAAYTGDTAEDDANDSSPAVEGVQSGTSDRAGEDNSR